MTEKIEEKDLIPLKEMQKIYYEMLIEFDALCKKYKLRYELGGGSMLGAARHHGFIPWDDDIDVNMPRTDYEKLLYLYGKGKVKVAEKRGFVSDRDGSFMRHYARYIRKDVGRYAEYSEDDDCPFIGIDIFPIDGVYENPVLFRLQVARVKLLRRMLLISLSKKGKSSRGKGVAVLKDVVRPVLRLIGSRRIARHLDHVCGEVDYRRAKYVAGITGMYGHKEKWLKTDYLPQSTILFGDRKFSCCKNYDMYLTNLYGDYMQLPPAEKQVPHCDPGYWID